MISDEPDQIAESLASVPRESPDDILKEGPPIRPEPDVLEWRPDSYWNADGARIEAAFREEAFITVIWHYKVFRQLEDWDLVDLDSE